jgi:branched-chain amino acid transport system substrate-binding protein
MHRNDSNPENAVTRREFLKVAGMAGATVGLGAGMGGLLAACGEEETTTTAASATTTAAPTTTTAPAATTTVSTGAEVGRPIKVGVTVPKTGIYAAFAEPMDFLIDQFEKITADGVVMGDGQNHPIELAVVDTQSDSNRAAQVAGDLITNNKVDLILSMGGPEVVIPAAGACEAMGCPSLNIECPWEAWVFSRGGTVDAPFKWTYLACNGVTEFIQADTYTMGLLPTNKKVGLLLANTADGQAWANGFPPALEAAGYTVVMPDLYPPGLEDFTSQISGFKKEGCEICLGTPSVPELANFWKQSLQQGYNPTVLIAGLPLMFPAAVNSIGPSITNACCEVNWHIKWPYKSTLTGQTGEELAAEYEAETGTQWNMMLGPDHQGFEWTVDVLKRATNVDDKEAILTAIKTTKIAMIGGRYDFTAPLDSGPGEVHPHPNVATMGMGSGQWIKGQKWPFDVVQVGAIMPELEVATTHTIQPMQYS